MHTLRHTFEEVELADGLYEVTADVEFNVSKYYPATMDNPPEGGEVEDVEFSVVKVVDEAGQVYLPGGLAAFAAKTALEVKFNDDEKFQDRVMNLCYERSR